MKKSFKRVFLLTILLLFLFAGCQKQEESTQDTGIKPSENVQEIKTDNIVVTVNGKELYQSQVDEFREALKYQTGKEINDTVALNSLILNTLFLQEAKRRGVSATTEEVKELMNKQLKQKGSSLEEYKQKITAQDYARILQLNKEKLLLAKLTSSLLNFTITDEEARKFFEIYKKEMVPEKFDLKFEEVKENIKKLMKQQILKQTLIKLGEELVEKAEIFKH